MKTIISYNKIKLLLLFIIGYNTILFGEKYIGINGPVSQSWSASYVDIGAENIAHWTSLNVNWKLNLNGAGDGLSFSATKAAVQNAFNSWKNVSSADIDFTYAGSTYSTWSYDFSNISVWAESGDPIFNFISSNTLAVTIISVNAAERFRDVDIVFNGRDFAWKVNGNDYDIQAVATHEIGHMIGLHHSEVISYPKPTMHRYYLEGAAWSTLEFDDRVGASFLYRGNLIDDETLSGTSYLKWNWTVQPGVTLNISNTCSLDLAIYAVSQNGGVIMIEDGAVINGTLLKTGATIDAIYPSIQAALNASSSSQTTVVINSQTVSSDLSVPTGRTLKFQPGITINFAQNTGLTINGKLTAIGTSQDKITFGFSGGWQQWWDGISFNDVSDNSSKISRAIIWGAVYGIKCYRANPTITWNQISGNQYGVHVISASPQIKYNQINQNVGATGSPPGAGIYVWTTSYSYPYITNNRIFNNTYGIEFVSVAHSAAFSDNDIYDNQYNFFGRDYTAPPLVYTGSFNNFYFQGYEWYDVGLRNGAYVSLMDNWWEEYPADFSEFDVDGSSALDTWPELLSPASHTLPKSGIPQIGEEEQQLASDAIKEFELFQNYPNPFNPSTMIKFQIPQGVSGSVILKVYNLLGEEVANLVNQNMSAGLHEIFFDASNLSSGIYFYVLRAGKYHSVNKMIYLR